MSSIASETETVTGLRVVIAHTLVYLDPSEIVEPDVTNVRPWSSRGEEEAEIKAIEALSKTIAQEGQLQPVKVRYNESAGAYELIAGRRRVQAIRLLNSQCKPGDEMQVAAFVGALEVGDAAAFRQALIENLHRKQMNAMEMAENIAVVRGKFGWAGTKGTKKVAQFFEVSTATITQYERLNTLPKELQQKVAVGELSREQAFDVVEIAEKCGVDAALKTVAAAEEAAAFVDAAIRTEKGEVSEVGGNHATPGERKQSKAAAAAKGKAIKAAVREADPDKPKPRSKSEIMEFFTSCLGPTYGHPNGAVHQFVEKLQGYAQGLLTDRTLYKYWDACVEKAAKGTAEKEPEASKPGGANKSDLGKSSAASGVGKPTSSPKSKK